MEAISAERVVLTPGAGTDILGGVDLKVEEGEFIAIVGPSGCGKTTFLNAVAGLTAITGGVLSVRGESPRAGRPDTGFALARDSLLPWRSAIGNVELALQVRRVAKAKHRRLAEEALKRVGLESALDRHPAALSQGMRQRVALARTFVTSPTLLLMDEPFGALDTQTRVMMQDLLLSMLNAFGGTLLFITHDLAEAIVLADRVVLFSNRPARVEAEYAVDIGRPRNIEDARNDAHFAALYNEMWTRLKHELDAESAY